MLNKFKRSKIILMQYLWKTEDLDIAYQKAKINEQRRKIKEMGQFHKEKQ